MSSFVSRLHRPLRPFLGAAVAVGAALLAQAPFANAANGIRAAYVEEVIPSRTYFGSTLVANATRVFGPGAGAGVLGISSLTLTNFDSGAQQVFLYIPTLAGSGNCTGTVIGGAPGMQMQVYVQPFATLHLTYPTPLVVNPVDGATCIAAQVTSTLHGGSVQIGVNGVLN